MSAPLPPNEGERVEALIRYRILDTPAEGEFDQYAGMMARLCDTEIGAMTLIDRNRQWVKSVHGPLARDIPRDHAFCPHTILQSDVLEVPDALADPRFAQSALVTGDPYVRFYAGTPLVTRNGAALGTLCVFGSRPGRLSGAQRRLMVIAAAHIGAQLELRRALVQLTEQKKVAIDCRDALADSNRHQQELTAMLVHDFKGPLTVVTLNSAWLAEDEALSAPQKIVALEIVDASSTLSEMVNDLLDVSRAEDGQLMLQHVRPTDLTSLVQAAARSSRAIAAGRDQRVEVVTRSGPVRVDGDAKLLTRVVNNLLDNAYKYAPSNSVIRVELSAAEREVLVRIVDEGDGIPPAQRELVFEKYFQLDDHRDQARPSHGLGLAFCRLAIEAHQGSIEVEDQPTGCAFRITLPRAA